MGAVAACCSNPTNIDIDAQGRIWVTEGVNYRRHKDRDAKGDRVVVLEDTDHDGRADSSSVFVQEPTLVAPLGIAVLDNKVIVSNAPDLIVYTDVNRDRKFDPAVDKREVLLSGFDGRNHDHALHSVTFGPDGRWYFSNGNAGANFTDRGGRTFRIGSAYNPVPDGGAQPVFGLAPPSVRGRDAATTAMCTSAASPRACSPTARAWKFSASISATATSRPSRASATSSTTTTTIRRPAALRI